MIEYAMSHDPHRSCFREGDLALLVDSRERTYLVSLHSGHTFHSHLGLVRHGDLIGKAEGTFITTNKGESLLAIRPTVPDYILNMPRHTNILYPKDLAHIILHAQIQPGSVVVEGGTGTGAAAVALLAAVGPRGRLITYEVREEFAVRALRNIEAFHPDLTNLTMRVADLYAGIEERDVDAVVLDLAEPWRVVGHAAAALRMGGTYVAYVPTALQLQQTVLALRQNGHFQRIDAIELMLRHWEAGPRSVRPAHRMIGHTGFLILARRCEPSPWQHGGTPAAGEEPPATVEAQDNPLPPDEIRWDTQELPDR